MARNPNYQIAFTWKDRAKQTSRHSVNTADLIAADPAPAAVTAYLAALAGITQGLIVSYSVNGTKKLTNAVQADDGHREDRWRVHYEDIDTLVVYDNDIPCRDTLLPTILGSDYVELDDSGVWAAFKTAFQNLAKSPDGNDVLVLGVEYVGKNG
jgi:hypothetical protein